MGKGRNPSFLRFESKLSFRAPGPEHDVHGSAPFLFPEQAALGRRSSIWSTATALRHDEANDMDVISLDASGLNPAGGPLHREPLADSVALADPELP
jgi:hypothetical protein